MTLIVAIWIFIGLQTFGGIVTITQVGKPREPISGPTAALVCVMIAAYIIGALNVLARLA